MIPGLPASSSRTAFRGISARWLVAALLAATFIAVPASMAAASVQDTSAGPVAAPQSGSCDDAIKANFNGTPIPAGSWLWLNSHLSVNNLPKSGSVTIHGRGSVGINGQTITLPQVDLTFSSAVFDATTSFVNGKWVTSVPLNASGSVFVTGSPVPLPDGLPGGLENLTWTESYDSAPRTPALHVTWYWSAAAYSKLSSHPSQLGVLAADGQGLHAGTPMNYRDFVIGGARGGGGGDFTGSNSATSDALVCVSQTPTPTPSTAPAPTPTPSPTPSHSPTPTPAHTPTPTPTPSSTPSATPSHTPTATPSTGEAPTPTPSGQPTPTPSGQPTPSITPTPSGDPTPTPDPSGPPTPTPDPSARPSPQAMVCGANSGLSAVEIAGSQLDDLFASGEGTYVDGNLAVDVAVQSDATFSWSSTEGIDSALVIAGVDQTDYPYDSAMSGDGIGIVDGMNELAFCYANLDTAGGHDPSPSPDPAVTPKPLPDTAVAPSSPSSGNGRIALWALVLMLALGAATFVVVKRRMRPEQSPARALPESLWSTSKVRRR